MKARTNRSTYKNKHEYENKYQVLVEIMISSMNFCFYYNVCTEYFRRSVIKANTLKQRFGRIVFIQPSPSLRDTQN